MSLFDDVPDDNQEVEPTSATLEDFVGEGKQFATVEDLLKSKLESNRFIAQLERENAEARDKLKSATTMEAIMTRIAEMNRTPEVPNAQPEPQQPAAPDNDSTNIKDMMEQMIAQYEQKQIVNKNSEFVEKKLAETFGADAQQVIRSKAKELSLSLADMQKLAVEKPQVFLSLVGVSEGSKAITAAPVGRGGQSPQAPSGEGIRNKKFYDKLKAQNFMEYISPKVQNQMMKDAVKLGDAFYN